MSPEYNLVYDERIVRSVANNTREDGSEFLLEAAAVPVKTSIQILQLENANHTLNALKNDAIRGAGVLFDD